MHQIPSRLKDEEKNNIIKKIQHRITPDDVIAALFSFIDRKEIPLDVQKIHVALYKIKKQHPEMLEQFSFSEKDVYPFSRLLERVLFRLQNSNLISTVNPDFKVCIIPDISKQYVQKHILPLFNEGDQKKLEQMGKLFEQLIM
jgi:hypothetical protein